MKTQTETNQPRQKILIVDDMKANLIALRMVLGDVDAEIIEANNGNEALAATLDHHFAVAILDVMMPEMDGYELAELLRGDSKTSVLPIIFVTAFHEDERNVFRGYEAGGIDYIVKPYNPEILLGKVRVFLKLDLYREELRRHRDSLELLVRERTAELEASLNDVRQAEKQLAERYEIQKLLTNISADLLQRPSEETDPAIEDALGKVGTFIGADRSYTFLFRPDNITMDNSHEWCAPGIDPQKQILQDLPIDSFPWAMSRLRRFESVWVPVVGELPAEAAAEKEIFEVQSIKSLLLVPFVDHDRVIGFLGLDWVNIHMTVTEDTSYLLQLTGDILCGALNRAKAAERIRRSDERKELALRGADLGSWDWNIKTGEVVFNARWAEMLGYSLTEIDSSLESWEKNVHPEDMPTIRRALEDHLSGRSDYYSGEHRLKCKSGEWIWVLDRGRVTEWDAEGKPMRAAGTHLDITEQKRSEELLKKREQEYRLLVENQTDLVVKVTPEGLFEFVSPSYCSLFGKTREELLGRSYVPLIHEDDQEATRRAMENLFKPPYTAHVEQRAMTSDGWRWLEWVDTAVLDEDGRVTAIIGVGRDITARKKAQKEKALIEAQLIQAQKMESIGILAGGIAHDFNNLLTTIIGNASLILMDVAKKDPNCEMVEEIKHAGEKASSLTSQLLAFSRKQVTQPELMSLNEVVGEMEKMLGRIMGEDIEVKTDLGTGISLVEADVVQMEQIIMNLATNARDAMPEGGTFTIETRDVTLDKDFARTHVSVTPGPCVELTVSDSGSGMSPEVQARLFEPFFTTKEKGKGTGLGMATVYGLVKQNKGTIWVDSEVGKGTSYRIYLPVCGGNALEPHKVDQETEKLIGSERILVVEDDDMLRNTALKALKNYGYKTLCAGNGPEALDVLKGNPGAIDLMLTDVVMPGMNGRELAEQAQGILPDLKILYMSGYTDDTIVHYGVLDKEISFLQKPFTPEGLARKIKKVLNHGHNNQRGWTHGRDSHA
jgi:PAS domain S-box-containing protein